MVSEVARNRFGSQEKRNFCCNGVGSWSMAPSKVLNCSHGLALSFEHSQYEQLAEGRALREFTNSGSLKKSSFFKKNFVLYPTIILFSVGSYYTYDVAHQYSVCSYRVPCTSTFVSGRLWTPAVSSPDAPLLMIRSLCHLYKTLSPSLWRGCFNTIVH